MIKEIVEDDKILHQKCEMVTDYNEAMLIAKDMSDTLVSTFETTNAGVAIACPQIGIHKNIIVVDFTDLVENEDDGIYLSALFNPEIVLQKGKQVGWEGCLSAPLQSGKVERPYYVKVKFNSEKGEVCYAEFEGFYAIVLSHEIDHLNGITYQQKAIKVVDHKTEDEKLEFRLLMHEKDPLTIISKE